MTIVCMEVRVSDCCMWRSRLVTVVYMEVRASGCCIYGGQG